MSLQSLSQLVQLLPALDLDFARTLQSSVRTRKLEERQRRQIQSKGLFDKLVQGFRQSPFVLQVVDEDREGLGRDGKGERIQACRWTAYRPGEGGGRVSEGPATGQVL